MSVNIFLMAILCTLNGKGNDKYCTKGGLQNFLTFNIYHIIKHN